MSSLNKYSALQSDDECALLYKTSQQKFLLFCDSMKSWLAPLKGIDHQPGSEELDASDGGHSIAQVEKKRKIPEQRQRQLSLFSD